MKGVAKKMAGDAKGVPPVYQPIGRGTARPGYCGLSRLRPRPHRIQTGIRYGKKAIALPDAARWAVRRRKTEKKAIVARSYVRKAKTAIKPRMVRLTTLQRRGDFRPSAAEHHELGRLGHHPRLRFENPSIRIKRPTSGPANADEGTNPERIANTCCCPGIKVCSNKRLRQQRESTPASTWLCPGNRLGQAKEFPLTPETGHQQPDRPCAAAPSRVSSLDMALF